MAVIKKILYNYLNFKQIYRQNIQEIDAFLKLNGRIFYSIL